MLEKVLYNKLVIFFLLFFFHIVQHFFEKPLQNKEALFLCVYRFQFNLSHNYEKIVTAYIGIYTVFMKV